MLIPLGDKKLFGSPGKAVKHVYISEFHTGIVKTLKLSTEGFVCYSAYN